MSDNKPEPCCPKCGSKNIDGEVDFFDIEYDWCYDCGWYAAAGLFNMIDRRKETAPAAPDESENAG